MALFGLTPAEARVAGQMARGIAFRAVGERLGISEKTVQAHARSIFRKCRVNRHPELVRVLLSAL